MSEWVGGGFRWVGRWKVVGKVGRWVVESIGQPASQSAGSILLNRYIFLRSECPEYFEVLGTYSEHPPNTTTERCDSCVTELNVFLIDEHM